MNPSSARTEVDKKRVRNEYLAELQRRSSLEQKILNANKLYTQTGQITSMPDTRTSTEKSMDKTRLTTMAMEFLKTITDPSTANNILQRLGLDELNFILNKREEITRDMRNQFAQGITEYAFFQYLPKLAQRLETTNDDLIRAIKETTANKEELGEMSALFERGGYSDVAKAINKYGDEIPSFNRGVDNTDEVAQALNNIVSTLIPKDDFDDMMDRLRLAVSTRDYELYNDVRNSIMEYVAIPSESVEAQQLGEARAYFSGGTELPARGDIPQTMEEFKSLYAAEQMDIIRQLRKDKLLPQGKGRTMKTIADRVAQFQEYLDSITKAEIVAEPAEQLDIPAEGRGMRRRRIRGSGVGTVKVSPLNIDSSKGIVKTPSYVPFGKHLLNRHKLNDGILMVKTVKGSGVADLPPCKVSSKMANVLRDYADEKMVSYDILGGLSDDEKDMLHKVAQKTQLMDKIIIPQRKTSNEKDNDNFVILKGEILAGNDNPKLVKEFKLLLIRLIKDKKVPRGEGNEILQMLLELGY